MTIPFEPVIAAITINIHLIFEIAAFFLGFRYYLFLRKNSSDSISTLNQLSIIVGAIFGALLSSKLVGYMENPVPVTMDNIVHSGSIQSREPISLGLQQINKRHSSDLSEYKQ